MNAAQSDNRRLRRLRRAIIPPLRASGLRHVVIPPLRAYFRYVPLAPGKVFVWERIASHLWWLETRVMASTRFGATLDVDARDDVGRFIYYFGVWEPHLTRFLERRLKPGDVFVDIGANVGYFSTLASALVGDHGRVVAIEAIPRTFEVLQRNIAQNHLHNVRAVNAAVWDKEETLTFFISPDTIDGTSTVTARMAERKHLQERCEVAAVPLISLLTAEEVSGTRLVKIDVEGAERRLLQDLGGLVDRGRKDVEFVVEVTAEAFDETVAFFRARGLAAYRLPNDYSPGPYCREEVAAALPRMDVLPAGETQADVVFSRIDAPTLVWQ